jgi:hypothetical protein
VRCRYGLAGPSGDREVGGGAEQPVAHRRGLGLLKLAVGQQRLGPGDRVVPKSHDLKPHLVERQLAEQKFGQPSVLDVADPVLDAGALAMTAFEDDELLVGWSVRVSWKRERSWSVNDSWARGVGRSRHRRADAGLPPSGTRMVVCSPRHDRVACPIPAQNHFNYGTREEDQDQQMGVSHRM